MFDLNPSEAFWLVLDCVVDVEEHAPSTHTHISAAQNVATRIRNFFIDDPFIVFAHRTM
jgi:hypothetical protein